MCRRATLSTAQLSGMYPPAGPHRGLSHASHGGGAISCVSMSSFARRGKGQRLVRHSNIRPAKRHDHIDRPTDRQHRSGLREQPGEMAPLLHSANADNRDAIFGYFNSIPLPALAATSSGSIIGMQYRRTQDRYSQCERRFFAPPLKFVHIIFNAYGATCE